MRCPVDVSVVVPTYNQENYIADCLDGILRQDFSGTMEILVGEDCSTDATATVVADYVRRYPAQIRLVTSPQNVGMHVNWRRLLTASRGRYVAICEGDDYWHAPDKLRVQVTELGAHPEAAGIHSDVDHLTRYRGRWVRMQGLWAASAPARGAATTHADLIVSNTVHPCATVLRGDVARSYPSSGWAQGMYAVEDWPLFLHTTEHGNLLVMDRSLATYRTVPGSVTNRGSAADELRILDQYRLIGDAVRRRGPEVGTEGEEGILRTRNALLINALRAGDRDMLRRALRDSRERAIPQDALATVAAITVRVPGAVGAASWSFAALHARRIRHRYA